VKRVYLDTCLIIDLIEGEPENQILLRAALKGKRVVGSELLRMEARIKALREQRKDFLDGYAAYFSCCEMAPLDRLVFEQATELRVRYRLKTPDALHLAVALQAGCGEFWSNDRQLLSAASGQIIIVDWNSLQNPS
jgi:uncharacterized protein